MIKKNWTNDAFYDTKKKSIHVVDMADELALYYKVLSSMYPKRFKLVKVKITIIT